MLNIILIAFSSVIPGINSVDSLRTEVIDGKTYIIHRVEAKETLFSISKKYGVALVMVVESNPNASSGVEIGSLIKVPYTPNNRTKTSEGIIHRVGQKETLYSIAKQYGVGVDEIKSWNKLGSNGLSLGQELLIKNKPQEKTSSNTVAPATTMQPPPGGSIKTHTVAASETMYAISRKYGVTVVQIKTWNNLTTTDLKPGQVIIVDKPEAAVSQNTASAQNTTPVQTKTETKPVNNNANASSAKEETIKPSVTTANTNTITIQPTESVIGSDEVRETGMALMLEGTEGNRKYLAYHRTVKVGTILRVKNNQTRKEVFVRVIGNLNDSEASDVVLRISKSALDKLGGDGKFPVEVTYFK